MRILLWHGYLLGGTGSNVYTRAARARMEPRGARRHRAQPGAASRGVRPRRGRDGAPGRRRVPAGLRPRPLRGLRGAAAARTAPRDESTPGSPRTRPPCASTCPPTSSSSTTSCSAAPSGRPRRAVRRQGARLRARVRDARERGAVGVGRARRWPAPRRRSSAPSTSARSLAEVCGHADRVAEVPPGVDVELWRPEARADALAALLAEAALDPPNPGNAEERLPDEGNAERLEAFLAADRPTVVYFGKLIPQKGVDVLLRSLRGLDARAVIVGFGPERARARGAGGSGGRRGAVHRARSSTATSATCSRSPTPASCPRSSPRRSGWSRRRRRLRAARRSSRATPASPRSPSGWRRTCRPRSARLVSSPTGDVGALHERLATLLALGADDRETLRAGVRRAVEARWSWASVASQLAAIGAG